MMNRLLDIEWIQQVTVHLDTKPDDAINSFYLAAKAKAQPGCIQSHLEVAMVDLIKCVTLV